MKIYNTLTKSKEEFIPLQAGKVSMYVCGPTVYNYIHIGNARPVVVFDTVRRYLEYKGFDVNFVSNFTDVDDKIIKKANEEGVTAHEISERYIKEYLKDTDALNVLPVTTRPKATEEIDGMIDMIEELIEKGHAYEKSGSVYFKTRSFKQYGKLSKKNIDDLEAGARIAVADQKDDPMDFVLWKPKKAGEPAWSAPWCDGRPGWHIECSVMSKKYLGDQIDIHAGGEDLIFPHHENEIAQTESCTGKEFAKYWMHNGFLNVDNKKMSKSEGNFFTVREIFAEYAPAVLRFFLLSVHYRSPINFSRDIIEASKNGLERIQTAVEQLRFLAKVKTEKGELSTALTESEITLLKEFDALTTKFEDTMDDDFNTADAISAIFEMVKLSNTYVTADSSAEMIQKVLLSITALCDILGLETEKKVEILDEEIEQLIADRQNARKAKDFAKSDEIRNLLLKKGIILEDTREGVKWKRA
ncbi:MAG TPA: cysteine--tRNA ligase [Lachnoclostridium phytofermentans]|uniref:Cysteine--tRNA ligase n=1 Tax=Lachnoclostridium phytofermentans TaxID=66219 RepID=A0A3D2X9S3_9FIRM|nr:cysteine--tRNA ligase [Lachnoclostridium sp.]HCL03275.1 cysteine--tRNA ligase [Lachnoclostridium phytofermentans]